MKKMMFNDRYGLTQAVPDGRKTMTRRLCNFKAPDDEIGKILNHSPEYLISQAPYKVGEIVAVAQSYYDIMNSGVKVPYKFDINLTSHKGWCNKMFVRADLMPHQIRIISIRAERLQDISEEDCLMEGVRKSMYTTISGVGYNYSAVNVPISCGGAASYLTPLQACRKVFSQLIDGVSGKGTWEHNPYVWRIEFEHIN